MNPFQIDNESLIKFAEYSRKMGDIKAHDWAWRMMGNAAAVKVEPLFLNTARMIERIEEYVRDYLRTWYTAPDVLGRGARGHSIMCEAINKAVVLFSQAPLYRIDYSYTLQDHRARTPPTYTFIIL